MLYWWRLTGGGRGAGWLHGGGTGAGGMRRPGEVLVRSVVCLEAGAAPEGRRDAGRWSGLGLGLRD